MRDTRPILLLTRPLDGSKRFAEAVSARFGTTIEAVIAPLQSIEWIETEPLDREPSALIFTSQNGVLGWNRDHNAFDGVAYCVGPQTTALALSLGLRTVDCGGSAEAVVEKIVADQPKGTAVHFRGVHGRGNISERLKNAGIMCEERIAYRQVALPPSQAFTQSFQSGRPLLAALFSPRSVSLFCEAAPRDATFWLAVISPNAAERVDLMLQCRMMVANAPNAGAMLDLVEEFLNTNDSGCEQGVS